MKNDAIFTKASKLKKDIRKTIRISSIVLSRLNNLGHSVQTAFDAFIDSKLNFSVKVEEIKPLKFPTKKVLRKKLDAFIDSKKVLRKKT